MSAPPAAEPEPSSSASPVAPPSAPGGRTVAIGILLMATSVGFFATMNMLVKIIGPDYHALEGVFFRNTIAAVLVIPFVLASGGLRVLKTRHPVGHALRALFGIASNALCFYAYQRIPLSSAMAVTMSVPIFAALLAIPLLGEKVGWHRWAAIVIGFGGVLIALNPQGAIQEGSLYALAGTLCWAMIVIFVKKLSATESPYAIVFYYMVTGALIATAFLPWVWVTPTPRVWMLYLATGIVGAIGQITMTFAMKLAPASVAAPFEYTQIIWAVLFDVAIWGVAPSTPTLVGAGIVIATGLYIFHRAARNRA
jgi:drug/metabolite transporter (DMT)-like permease